MEIIGLISTLATLYLALLIVITLHEIGHIPKKIKFKFGIIPSAVAIKGRFRETGLLMNIILFILVYYYKPELVLFQYIGLISWMHFIFYAIVGSIIPEPDESRVNTSTYVFDDVENDWVIGWWIAAGIAIFVLKDYYLPILTGIFA